MKFTKEREHKFCHRKSFEVNYYALVGLFGTFPSAKLMSHNLLVNATIHFIFNTSRHHVDLKIDLIKL